MNDNRYVTLKDLATECGVTHTTVSLALRNHPRISSATRKKVHEAADRLGYCRHPMLSALMTNLKQTRESWGPVPLAAVYTHSTDVTQRNTYQKKIWRGMESRAHELGYKLEKLNLELDKINGKRMTQILSSRGITGLIIPPISYPNSELGINWDEFSVVAIGHSLAKPNLHRICPDQYSGIRQALEELTRLGYTRPGLVLNSQSDLRTAQLWSSGFYGFEHEQKKQNIIPVLECDVVDAKKLNPWFSKYQPDIIISSDPTIVEPLKQCKIKFPDDVGLITLSEWEADSGIAGIDQNADLVGSAAIEQLIQQLYHNERGIPDMPRLLQIPSRWGEGTSIKMQN